MSMVATMAEFYRFVKQPDKQGSRRRGSRGNSASHSPATSKTYPIGCHGRRGEPLSRSLTMF
jgi:hypothetical protein